MIAAKQLPVMEDYLRLRYVGDPCSQNRLVAWTASGWDIDAPAAFRRFREEVRLAEIEEGHLIRERTITAGGSVERSPILASDGSVWFLSNASLKTSMPEHGMIPQRIENELYSQMQLYHWKNGESRQLTHMLHGINRFFVSPDEKKIFFLSWKYEQDKPKDLIVERTEEERAAELEARLDQPFITEKQSYKSDAELGYRSVRAELLWLMEGDNVRCLLDEEASFSAPCWMPDSKTILFQRIDKDEKLEFCTLDTENGTISTLATVKNADLCFEDDYEPLIDETNHLIIFAANAPKMEFADPRGLYTIPLSGGNDLEARRLLSPDADVDGVFSQDMNFSSRGYHEAEFIQMPNGRCFYTTGFRGDVRIASVSVTETDSVPVMVTGEMANYHCLRPYDADHILALCGMPERLPELALVNIHTGETVILTDSNPWMQQVQLQKPLSVWTKSGTHGFYLPPIGAKGPAPAILYCHGGPTGFYCSGLNYEFHALAAAGFGVLYANPRGGTGYGRERNKDEYAYDGTALADLLEFVDTVCQQHPELDSDRIGICGGSYGGFMTLHAVSRCERFKAASAHRALANMQMISASSHSAGGHTREEFPTFLDWIKKGIQDSPASYVDKIKIPLQILQSDLDANCVPEQANQIYTAMRAWNPQIPCEYILYPDSGHGIGHKGPMELAVHHRNANLRWFKTYL